MQDVLQSGSYFKISKPNFKNAVSIIEGECYLTDAEKDKRITNVRLEYLKSLKIEAEEKLNKEVMSAVKIKFSATQNELSSLIRICNKTANTSTLARVRGELNDIVVGQTSFLEEIIGM
jgi:hypothetical protein